MISKPALDLCFWRDPGPGDVDSVTFSCCEWGSNKLELPLLPTHVASISYRMINRRYAPVYHSLLQSPVTGMAEKRLRSTLCVHWFLQASISIPLINIYHIDKLHHRCSCVVPLHASTSLRKPTNQESYQHDVQLIQWDISVLLNSKCEHWMEHRSSPSSGSQSWLSFRIRWEM